MRKSEEHQNDKSLVGLKIVYSSGILGRHGSGPARSRPVSVGVMCAGEQCERVIEMSSRRLFIRFIPGK